MKVYLHLGLSKTGTSFLQSILHDPANASYWKDHRTGVVSTLFEPERHTDITRKDYDLLMDPDVTVSFLQSRLESTLLNMPADKETLIYSNEATGNIQDAVAAKKLIDCFRGHDVRMILFLRRQDIRLQSAYAQAWVGIDPDKEKFLERVFREKEYFLHYSTRLKCWSELVGKEHVWVRAYEKEQMPAGIEKVFFDMVGVSVEDLHIPIHATANPGLTPEAIQLIGAHVHRRYPNDQPKRLSEVSRLKRLLAAKGVGTLERFSQHALFTPEECAAILDGVKEDNAWIAREYLGRSDGRLFYDETIPEKTSGTFSDSERTEILNAISEGAPDVSGMKKRSLFERIWNRIRSH